MNAQATATHDGLVHRRAMSGRNRAQCGATAPERGYINLSTHGVRVTCPDCQPKQPASIIGIDCPRCSYHGWAALTPEAIESTSMTCAGCNHSAPVRDFIK